ncbi:site-specific integrase [Anaerosacchariphilus polymeriproducens]|uniref:Site-specific integrase n=1 Tax=Anaerosacchariphilus polymeriproducens TaxID=1812858 RepID=A0A371AV21_9FIRM|nr:site-specific integrase [Anaerosacchariphilus polymeriproducens]RDU23416.1 site-specific integrase [Anaerosacchariphilus polymeriproducens]
MSASKDLKRGTWKVYCYYTDWQGNRKPKTKRGFQTKKEALEWERDFLQSKSRDINMSFETFVSIYLDEKTPRIKYNTYLTKKHIIEKKILPYFSKKNLSEITVTDVMQWQNELIGQKDEEGKSYSPTYLRTVQNQLSAVFNHACKFYGLSVNPSSQAGKMGKAKAKEMLFWTRSEYSDFMHTMYCKPVSYYAFETLYWCGIREGELLALTVGDIDLVNRKMIINKSYQRLKGKDYITEPKTEKSNRVIDLPNSLCLDLEDYLGMMYGYDSDTRLFPVSKSYLHHEMDRGCKESGVKRIRIHDIRHSHCAHLIELGFSPVEIAERLGHESISVTYTYAHLYPSKQLELAKRLDEDRGKDYE